MKIGSLKNKQSEHDDELKINGETKGQIVFKNQEEADENKNRQTNIGAFPNRKEFVVRHARPIKQRLDEGINRHSIPVAFVLIA